MLGVVGVLPIAVSAELITDADVSIDFIIDDGDPADLHDENGWLVAGSGVSSTIRVDNVGEYIGAMPPDIHFVRVTSLDEDTYGKVKGGDATGLPCEIVFPASKKTAGYAPIQVHINYSADGVGYDYYRTVYQPIDHNVPKNIQNIVFESEVTLDRLVNITMMMEDAYGNTVTSLYEDVAGGAQECVTFETTSYAGSGFYDGIGYDAEVVIIPVNAEGSVVATFKAGIEAGPNYLIHIKPDMNIHDKWLTVTALANGVPYFIAVSVAPNVDTPPYIPADGESKFYLTYDLTDKYGNPSADQIVNFTYDDAIGDVFSQRTNSDGQIMFTFGPFDTATTFTISAEAAENASVTVDQVVRFTNTSPEDMILTANPQSMPSADVPNAGGADVLAKVMDEHGNGVPLEVVSFFVVSPVGGYCAEQKTDPSIVATALTDVDGIARAHFTPGSFITNDTDADYNATATESCTVLATWGAKTRTIDLEWKNYPYLRVETDVNPETVKVGEPVDVTIRLIGDGWALYSEPIDVMISADRSWSMLSDYPDRMVSLMDALTTFNALMTDGWDGVGLTSFGNSGKADLDVSPLSIKFNPGVDGDSTDFSNYILDHYPGNKRTYSDYATLDLSLSRNRSVVEDAIEQLVPFGYTPMRPGLYLAIKEIIENGREDAVKAVILLSDGDYNSFGDPLARGAECYSDPTDMSYFGFTTEYYYPIGDLSPAEQNLSVYANNNNITIYSIALGDGLSLNGIGTLRTLAESTGGTFFYAPTGDDLAGIYIDIAGVLKTEAGVNTEMDVLFTSTEVNNETLPNDPFDPILEYEYEDGVSTLVKSWNASGSEGLPNIRGPLPLDQRDDWAANRSLNFESDEIGTIQLGQTWQAEFRLNVSKPGNINIFGDSSIIFFNNGTDSLTLPKTYVTAVPDLNATGINFTGLQVYGLVCAEADGVIENYLTMDWNLDYSGNLTATQCLYYQRIDDGVWFNFGYVPVTGPVSALAHTRQLYVADFPPGEYRLRVRAVADDAPDSVIETSAIVIGQGGNYFIRLE
ncbi:VWA domain-containing protein [Methanogenium sp. S4BF]|uniref:VWA domain-containing protein n=1 Tax=Methanogenium sp. S4BF TaxID=1789226 RepID=UPI002416780A|nr:VWA domain-containing protein [Methanogenium sp. S4BF]WFN33571.1 VWA domain-containing protein [Methanogenium sp. S4BF]